MPAGFNINGKTFYGSNVAIESYIEAIAKHAQARFGAEDEVAVFFRDAKRGYFTGMIVFLDPVLRDAASRARFIELLDAATEDLSRQNMWTERGKAWVSTRIPEFRQQLASSEAAG
jgi:hypothetical protein